MSTIYRVKFRGDATQEVYTAYMCEYHAAQLGDDLISKVATILKPHHCDDCACESAEFLIERDAENRQGR